MNLSESRRDYRQSELLESSVHAEPILQFRTWLEVALKCDAIDEAYAMTVATAGGDGKPSARIMLLRRVDEHGFLFFTNYDSRKGHEIAEHADVALVFYWGPLERQVRVEGTAVRASAEDSDAYFSSRPHKSRLGALVSKQSSVIPDRASLSQQMDALGLQYPEGADVPRPEGWGGYVVRPEDVEFWQGRPNRLHDRLRYRRNGERWVLERLAP